MIYLDSETCGLVGPAVLIQYKHHDEGVIHLHNVWKEPVYRTLNLIERLASDTVCGFNLVFDWFHINKLYNILVDAENKSKPPDIRETYQACRNKPRRYCIKPAAAVDLYLTTKKSEWQSLMHHEDTRIRRVPRELANDICLLLAKNLRFPDIFHANWIMEPDPDDVMFADIILRFKPTSALKAICKEIFKCGVIDFPVPKRYYPIEFSYDPYDKYSNWPEMIPFHINFWSENKVAKSYAEQDIVLLERLYEYFVNPAPDTDSILACAVGAARWRGFEIDTERLSDLADKYAKDVAKPPCPINAHREVKKHLKSLASPLESVLISDTSKQTLQTLIKLNTKVGIAAKEIMDARKADRGLDVLGKLAECGRFCPEFRIIGTRSGRMSGGSEFGFGASINPQGIQRDPEFRKVFRLSDISTLLSGGDFDSFEVTIADAAYQDAALRRDLESGKKFHGLLGEEFYDLTHDEILATKGTTDDKYATAKNTAFGFFYGAMVPKLSKTAGVEEDRARQAYQRLAGKYPGMATARERIFRMFCSMQQPGGIGTRIIWNEPARYVESLLGFRRYFDLENSIVRTFFELAQSLPPELSNKSNVMIRRKDRLQTVSGATQSALFAAAFQLQASNMRAAANHVIQSTGAEITKNLQHNLWNLQPPGISEWKIALLNLHDEVLAVHDERLPVATVVQTTVQSFKPIVPLIKMDWRTNVPSWGEMKE